MKKKLKKWNKYSQLSKLGILKKKLRDKTYLLIRKIINYKYHKKLSNYPELKDLIDDLSRKNKMSADLSDCIALYEDILNLKPEFILELGPGTSTAAISLAINQVKKSLKSYSPVFIAVESRDDWLNYHKENIPNKLLLNVDLISRAEKLTTLNGEEVAYYENLPLHPYDFIHVDGPDIHGLGVDLQGDLIFLEKHLNNNCLIIFDGRRNAARFSRKYMSGFKFRRHSKTLNHMISKTNLDNGFIFDFLIKN